PAAAACAPETMSSLYSWPGSRRCTWRSTKPGVTTLPAQSITRAPAAASAPPTAATRPSSSIATSATRSRLAAGSMTRPPRSTSGVGTGMVYRLGAVQSSAQRAPACARSAHPHHARPERPHQLGGGLLHHRAVLALEGDLDLV